LKLPAKHCPSTFLPSGLEFKILKMGVSLAPPLRPKSKLQRLPTTLRIKTLKPIPSCSKASGVFSSRCRYPASSRESHFHRARRRDSFPVVTPFVRFGTYPKRNCATLERFMCYSVSITQDNSACRHAVRTISSPTLCRSLACSL